MNQVAEPAPVVCNRASEPVPSKSSENSEFACIPSLTGAIDRDDRKHGPSAEALKKGYIMHRSALAAHAETIEPELGVPRFTSQEELEALTADWPSSRLVDIWNRLPGNTPVKKFTNRQTAIRRIWKALEASATAPAAARPVQPSKPRKPGAKVAVVPPQPATKSETIVALLRKPGGATLKAIMEATGWQAHSVRGFISGQLTKKMRLKIKSVKRAGERVYSVRS
jgi:uncharacterized protein DUF3489